jgi:hypothetical protein
MWTAELGNGIKSEFGRQSLRMSAAARQLSTLTTSSSDAACADAGA